MPGIWTNIASLPCNVTVGSVNPVSFKRFRTTSTLRANASFNNP